MVLWPFSTHDSCCLRCSGGVGWLSGSTEGEQVKQDCVQAERKGHVRISQMGSAQFCFKTSLRFAGSLHDPQHEHWREAKYLGKNGGNLGGNGSSMIFGGARWQRLLGSPIVGEECWRGFVTIHIKDCKTSENVMKLICFHPCLRVGDLCCWKKQLLRFSPGGWKVSPDEAG